MIKTRPTAIRSVTGWLAGSGCTSLHLCGGPSARKRGQGPGLPHPARGAPPGQQIQRRRA
jgi:hypothetical protein